jgi:hypothetical protein
MNFIICFALPNLGMIMIYCVHSKYIIFFGLNYPCICHHLIASCSQTFLTHCYYRMW